MATGSLPLFEFRAEEPFKNNQLASELIKLVNNH